MAHSMKRGDIGAEVQLIKTLCRGKKAAFLILKSLERDLFAFEDTLSIYDILAKEYINEGKPIPKLSILIEHPFIPDDSKSLLKSSKYEHYVNEEEAGQAVEHLIRLRNRRLLVQIQRDIVEGLRNGEKEASILSGIDDTLFRIRACGKDDDIVHFGVEGDNSGKKLMKKILSKKQEALSKCGWKQLDEKVGGFRDGDLIIMSANTGGGKSVAAKDWMANTFLLNKENSCLASLEMDTQEVYERVLSAKANILYSKVKRKTFNEEEERQLIECWEGMEEFGMKYNCRMSVYAPTGDVTIQQVLAPLVQFKYKWVFLDYISLFAEFDEGSNEAQSLGKIARYCKRWARTNACKVVLLTQINENMEMRYSKAIKEHANYWLRWNLSDEVRESGVGAIELAKGRSSELGDMPMAFELQYQRITDLDEEKRAQLAQDDDDSPNEEPRKKKPKEASEFTPKGKKKEKAKESDSLDMDSKEWKNEF